MCIMIMLKTKKSGENGDGVYLYMLCVVAINKKYFWKFSVGYCVLSENRDFLMSMFLLLLLLLSLLPLSISLRENASSAKFIREKYK